MKGERAHQMAAWRNVLLVAGLCSVVIGLPTFVYLTRYLPTVTDLRTGSAWFLGTYTVAVWLVVGVLVIWLRRAHRSLADIGWARPTSRLAVMLALAWAGLWLAFSLLGASVQLRNVPAPMGAVEVSGFRFVMGLDGLLISIGEEVINRGFIMTELQSSQVGTGWQILASGLVFATYHSLGNLTLLSIVPSFVFGTTLAGLYVLGRRSLTPSIASHGLVNLLGEPILVMSLLASGYGSH